MSTPLSVLDLTQIEKGSTSATAIHHAVELAQQAERLGYTRVWYAEHHNSIGLASGSPEIMIAHVANHTSTIRLGSGGVMLPNHAPLKIAEVFRLLEAIHPGRIDLGLGRAPGTDTLTAYALRRSEEALDAENYPQLLAELLALDQKAFPDDHPFRKIDVTPADVQLPPIWLLGSSGFSAQLAAQVGLGFSFASHINRGLAADALRVYREQYTPSGAWPEPMAMLAVGVVVGETQEHAEALMKILQIGFSDLVAGRPYQMPTLEEAERIEVNPVDLQRAQGFLGNWFVGTAESVAEEVRALAEASEADEVMITTALPNQEDRLRTVRGFAEAWKPAPAASR
ncbi:MAG TPA: LLM class flavin-dependent oxidoreductase [Thermomicrobiales bacterium]|nr:LLM class flavin-dependent oxidoreductase [Thermomicrobiales bacterium]